MLQDDDIDMYSTHNEGKSVVAKRIIRALKNKDIRLQYRKNIYIDKLADFVNKYYTTYHSTTKMKPLDLYSSAYIDFGVEKNDKVSIFNRGDHERRLKYKLFLQKVTLQIEKKKFL